VPEAVEVDVQLSSEGLYFPPELVTGPPLNRPPQTTISLPVQTAASSVRSVTPAPVDVGTQELLDGL
jgi:hypothetical protein